MALRRVISALSVVVVATGGMVMAAPQSKKGAPAKKDPAPAPAKDPAPATTPDPAATPGGAGSGSAVQPIEDTPPADMNGTDENPDAPKGVDDDNKVHAVAPAPKKAPEYPIEEALRPITLLQNLSELSISPHAQIGDGSAIPYAGGDALRARYGITNEVQLGFTYVFAGIYPDPANTTSYQYGIHSGKAIGFDVTVKLQEWLAVKVGVPVYLSPVAVSFAAGAPIKFHFGDKFAIGGLDDLLNIKIKRFAPSYYQEYYNAVAANQDMTNTLQSNGDVRVSVYGVYQTKPDVAILGRFGVDVGLSTASSATAGGNMGVGGGTTTFLRGGVQWTPRRYIDIGGALGFDDLGHIGSFGPSAFLAVRI